MKKIRKILLLIIISFLVAAHVNAAMGFIGSKTSNKYHYPTCKWVKQIKPYKVIKFDSPENAVKAGYIPCPTCRPPLPDKTTDKTPKSKPLQDGQAMISPVLGAKFALIPSGSFMMGSASGEPGRDNDEIQHRVTIGRSFYMQTTEVTQGQWKRVMGNNPSHFSNCGVDCPVEKVSWHDIQEFIGRLNQMESKNPYRLPTEAEWEYAARAGTITRYYSGNSANDLSGVGWHSGNSGSKTHAVAQKRPNAWGLYDMHGNVWEWGQDWKSNYPSGHVIDPAGPSSGSIRVMRGGSWRHGARFCRTAYRCNRNPDLRDYRMGFRLVRNQ